MRRRVYTLDEFLAEIIDPEATFRTVRVKKARRQFMFCASTAELVRLRIGVITQDSFCIEDEKAEHIVAALRALGLDSHANVNFPKGLAQAMGC